MEKKVANIAMIVLVINLLSRALALVANSLITAYLGVNMETSAYSFALTLTSIITTIIGTTLTTSVIPIYTDLRENHPKDRSNRFLNNTISLTVLVSFALIAIGFLIAPLLAKISPDSDFSFGVFAIRVLLFSIVFICLYYVASSILQANGRFYMVAMVSLPSSLVSIIYLLFLSGTFGVSGLLFATLTGFFLQAAFLFPALGKTDFVFFPSFHYGNEDIKKIFKVVAPVIIGVCAYQINMLTNNGIAFSYDPEHYVVLNNAQNLGIQIVMTLILAVSSVIYPKLSTLAAKKDEPQFFSSLSTTLNSMILLLVPISAAYYLYSGEVMDLVYGYGKFTPENVALGGSVFALYSFGILGMGFKEIIDRAFYSLKNTKTSAYNGVLIMVVNIGLSVVFVKQLGLLGIAAAYSLASLCGGANILWQFKRKNPDFTIKPMMICLGKAILACGVMVAALLLFGKISFGGTKGAILLKLGFLALTGALIYGVTLIILQTKEVTNILKRKD